MAKRDPTIDELLTDMADSHSNLTAFGAIQDMAESSVRNQAGGYADAQRIVAICKSAARKQLRLFDAARHVIKSRRP